MQPQPLPQQPDGMLRLGDIAAAIKPDDEHFARGCSALENTLAARCCRRPLDAATDLAHARQAATHLTARGCSTPSPGLRRQRRGQDARLRFVSVFFSKGLGAPVGSALDRPARADRPAHRVRKMRSAAGCARPACWRRRRCHALDHHVDRLATMRTRAPLADGWQGIPGVTVTAPGHQHRLRRGGRRAAAEALLAHLNSTACSPPG